MDEATRDLRLQPQEVLEAYNELVVEGWIKGKPDGTQPGTPQNQPPQPQPTPTAQPQAQTTPQQQTPQNDPTKDLHLGEQPRDRFDPNSPFLER
jgi:DNA-binding transcriptional MocR family regulator